MNQNANQLSISAPARSLTADVDTHRTLLMAENLLIVTNGKRELAEPLTGDARHVLNRRIGEIRKLLSGANSQAERQAIASAVALMLAGFASARTTDTKGMLATYTAILSDLPAWAVEAVCADVRKGGAAGVNADFAPSAARLHQLVDERLDSLRAEQSRIHVVLTSPVTAAERIAPPDEVSRVKLGFQQLGAQLGGNSTSEQEQRDARKNAANVQAMTREQARVRAEYAAMGRDVPSDLALSITARRAMEMRDEPVPAQEDVA